MQASKSASSIGRRSSNGDCGNQKDAVATARTNQGRINWVESASDTSLDSRKSKENARLCRVCLYQSSSSANCATAGNR